MSFKDFNEEGPGTFAWDYVLGQNTTGLFPDETHYLLDGDILREVTFTYAGGETWNALIGDCWNITDIKPNYDGSFTFRQNGILYRATVNRKLHMKDGQSVYDIVELGR